MGCGGSKIDNLPLVTLCRERRDFIRAASDRRCDLAAAHVTYFQSLRDVGEALRRYSDEELAFLSESASVPGSPVLTLPSDEGKGSRKKSSSSSLSISHSVDEEEGEDEGHEGSGSHLHLSDGSESGSDSGHIQIEESPEEESYYPSSNSYPNPYMAAESYFNPGDWGPSSTSYMHYAKRSETKIQSMVYDEPDTEKYSSWHQQYNFGSGFFGFSMGSPEQERQGQADPPPPSLPPPSPPVVSTWDYLNFFDGYDEAGAYQTNYPSSRFGYGSNTSSPNSSEVREREGIPDLEDETDPQPLKVRRRKKKAGNGFEDVVKKNVNPVEGTSRSLPKKVHGGEGLRRAKSPEPIHETEIKSSSGTFEMAMETNASKSPEEDSLRKKGVSFENDEVRSLDVESSKRSGLAILTVHRTRELQEVVKEIRDEFEIASGFGREVAVLLEVGKLPYQRRATTLRVIFSRILYLIAPSMVCSHPPSMSVRLSSRTMKMAKEYEAESGEGSKRKSLNLSSTLDKLYAWEKKLHKEVKDEERLRVIYEKQCRKLRYLDEHGAESGKIDATEVSVRKLLTKINVCIKAVDVISSRIHKLRDEELLPQVTELIQGLIKMWKAMVKCHQKQFHAIMESKLRKLKGKTGFHRDTGLKAIIELEMELLNWCMCFNSWVDTQKLYVRSLHEWLSRCILEEPVETDDGFAPFSPTRAGAPPIFAICDDWAHAMERISGKRVLNAMSDFAATLHGLWETQGDTQRRRVEAEFLTRDFERRLRQLRAEKGKLEQEHRDASSDRTAGSRAPSGSGVSLLDDLKVDLDSMSKKLAEEKARHKEAFKQAQDAASSSLQEGLTPIFEALGSFSSQALKAHEHVRLQQS